MSNNDIALAERRQQILNIEPAEYVAQVFEPFAKRLAVAIADAKKAEYDVTTTIGMATAVRHRRILREIRTESESARKERKAPILEIGKLLDGRQKAIEAEIQPIESRFDADIKAEEKRKDDEKQAKALAARRRFEAIQNQINAFRSTPLRYVGQSSTAIVEAASALTETVIDDSDYEEFTSEARIARDQAAAQLRELADKARAAEEESARLAAERQALAKQRAAQIEEERKIAAARAEQEERQREARAAEFRERQAAHERAEAALRAEREELARQQAQIDAERQRQANAEATRRRAEIEAAEAAEIVKEARLERERQEAEQAERAAQEEADRRARVDFEKNGPRPDEIIATLASDFGVAPGVVLNWLRKTTWKKIEVMQ